MSMLISIVLPAYKAKFLSSAIESILAQSYTNFELIIVDDCSPEDLKVIVDQFQDNRISYYRNTQNIGGNNLVDQWNNSIRYANGDYLVLAADDDTYDRDFLSVCVDLAIKYPDVNLIRGRVNCIDEKGDDLSHEGELDELITQEEYIKQWGIANIYICIGNFMFKTKVLKQTGFINFPSAFCSDIATSIQMADKGVANSKNLLFNFRISSIHLSSSISTKQLDDKLVANNEFYKWLFELELIRSNANLKNGLYNKFVFDAYNQVFKFLQLSKIHYAFRFTELSYWHRCKMILRYFYQRITGKI